MLRHSHTLTHPPTHTRTYTRPCTHLILLLSFNACVCLEFICLQNLKLFCSGRLHASVMTLIYMSFNQKIVNSNMLTKVKVRRLLLLCIW